MENNPKPKSFGNSLWSKDDLSKLKKLYGNLCIEELAILFQRPARNIIDKAHELGIIKTQAVIKTTNVKRRGRPLGSTGIPHKSKSKHIGKWSANDLRTLRELYPYTDTSYLARHLKRTHMAINNKAYDLGVKKANFSGIWTPEEIRILRELYPTTDAKDLTTIFLKRSVKAIRSAAAKHNIRKEYNLTPSIPTTSTKSSVSVPHAVGKDLQNIVHKIGISLIKHNAEWMPLFNNPPEVTLSEAIKKVTANGYKVFKLNEDGNIYKEI